ncbi:MAG: PrgI family protein [Candidatus Nomurabacteria bacterium]|jgi:hypothetical protein|nr:PrgI family protein [Candidatus Nomurabacteria bacterium]
MGNYKVPQNVEAEDKILGPFSFRQFIYLLVAAGCGTAMWFLGAAYWALALIPLPIFVLALALALPLRKDQPMETYLLAIVKFLFVSKKRLWVSGSFTPNVEVDATEHDDSPPIKDIRGADAADRISFLSQVLDSAGWSTRGVDFRNPNENINEKVASSIIKEADIHDQFEDNSTVAQSIENRLGEESPNTAASAIINSDNV